MTHSKSKTKPEITIFVKFIHLCLFISPDYVGTLHTYWFACWVCRFTKSQCGCWWCLCFLSLTRYGKNERFHFCSFAKWFFFFRGHLVGFALFCGRMKIVYDAKTYERRLKLRRWHLFSFHSFVRRFVDVEKNNTRDTYYLTDVQYLWRALNDDNNTHLSTHQQSEDNKRRACVATASVHTLTSTQ